MAGTRAAVVGRQWCADGWRGANRCALGSGDATRTLWRGGPARQLV